MKISWLSCIGFLFVFLLSSVICPAQDLKFTARVQIDVSGNENIKGLVGSYLNRELRSLGDVELVEKDPDFFIAVGVLEIKPTGGRTSGFSLSTVVLHRFDNRIISSYFKDGYKEAGMALTSYLYRFPNMWVDIAPRDSLQEICKGIIANFDTQDLEPIRKLYRK